MTYTVNFNGIQLLFSTFSEALTNAIIISRLYSVEIGDFHSVNIVSNLTGEVLVDIRPHEDPYITSSVTYVP